jgi:iron(III) transport system substrate-binding protein
MGERIFSRVAQEYASGLHVPDTVSTGDAAQFLAWKRQKLLAPYVSEDVSRHISPEHRDPDGFYATVRSSLCVIAYNTDLVKREEAPKSFADLLDPKWKGKIVKAHPSYSGTIMTSTYQMVRELGWSYLEKLALQQVLQIQSATDAPKKIVLGERPVMADGNESNVLLLKEAGSPIEVVYAVEGTPSVVQPSAIFVAAPHPNAARLFQSYLFSPEGQELFVNLGGLRSVHALVKDKPGLRHCRPSRSGKTTPPQSKLRAKKSSGGTRKSFVCNPHELRCGTANRNTTPKIVIPMATAAIGAGFR